MQQHHVGVLREGLVEDVPDAGMIVAVGAAGEGDPIAGAHKHFVLGAAAGGEELRLSIGPM